MDRKHAYIPFNFKFQPFTRCLEPQTWNPPDVNACSGPKMCLLHTAFLCLCWLRHQVYLLIVSFYTMTNKSCLLSLKNSHRNNWSHPLVLPLLRPLSRFVEDFQVSRCHIYLDRVLSDISNYFTVIIVIYTQAFEQYYTSSVNQWIRTHILNNIYLIDMMQAHVYQF